MKRLEDKFFYLIIAGLFLVLISPILFSEGMFMDGLIYAGLSKNLANGLGTFWKPHFSQTMFPAFYEHPPLAFGLQSLFFRIFGDSIFVERFYSLGTVLITAVIIIKIMELLSEKKHSFIIWLPLLFWISFPLLNWSVSNNMLENTMMIFSTLAVCLVLKHHFSKSIFYLILAGFSLFLAFLSKGLPGLFPLSIPFWMFVFRINAKFKSFITNSLVLLFTLVLLFLFTFLIFPDSYLFFQNYWQKQIVGSIQSVETVSSRFFILFRLFNELIPSIVIGLLFFIAYPKIQMTSERKKWFMFFLGLALSGVVPIMISLKQSGFYIVPTFPFFALAFSMFLYKNVAHFVEKLKAKVIFDKLLVVVSVAIFIFGIALNIYPHKGRDIDKIHDVKIIVENLEPKSIITIDSEIWMDYSLYAYFVRFSSVSLSRESMEKYYLKLKSSSSTIPVLYKKSDLELRSYELYRLDLP